MPLYKVIQSQSLTSKKGRKGRKGEKNSLTGDKSLQKEREGKIDFDVLNKQNANIKLS